MRTITRFLLLTLGFALAIGGRPWPFPERGRFFADEILGQRDEKTAENPRRPNDPTPSASKRSRAGASRHKKQ